MKTVITAERLFTPTECIELPLVTIEDGHIAALASCEHAELPSNARHMDFPGMVLAPGFIDIHIHGGAGHDVMEAESSALAAIETAMARTGVTSYLPTTVTAPEDRLLQALDHLGRAVAGHEKHKTRALYSPAIMNTMPTEKLVSAG